MQFGAEFVRLGGDDREAGHPLPGRHAVKIAAQRPVALLPPWRLRRQPGSPKRSSHRIAAGGRGGSETFFRSRCRDFCGCCGWPGFQSLIEPHCQRDPTTFCVDLQHLDTNDIAGLRNCAWVFHISIGHRGDVHQPVLMDPHINEGAERGDVCHDTFENHAGLQILELFHSCAEARRLESRARITSGLFEFGQDVGDGRHPENGIRERLWLELTEYRCVTNQPLQLALGCRKDAPHDGVGFRMYARRIEWIVAVADAQETRDSNGVDAVFTSTPTALTQSSTTASRERESLCSLRSCWYWPTPIDRGSILTSSASGS